MKAKAEELAAEVVDQFEKEWAPIMEGVKEASETFDNLEGTPKYTSTPSR